MGLQICVKTMTSEPVEGAGCSYGAFNSIRRRIAKEIGIDLDEMVGFKKAPNGVVAPAGVAVPWETLEWDDLFPLLNHSDCDGEITADECRVLIPRLREIMRLWGENDEDFCFLDALVEGMEQVVDIEMDYIRGTAVLEFA